MDFAEHVGAALQNEPVAFCHSAFCHDAFCHDATGQTARRTPIDSLLGKRTSDSGGVSKGTQAAANKLVLLGFSVDRRLPVFGESTLWPDTDCTLRNRVILRFFKWQIIR